MRDVGHPRPDEAPQRGEALLLVNLQNDFLPGGAFAVPGADAILAAVNARIAAFSHAGLPVVASRDWHPADHCSFRAQGGRWPPHCIAGRPGADFPPGLHLPGDAIVFDKGFAPARDTRSAFQDSGLGARLRALDVIRVFVCGLATDYCVRESVLDALRDGFEVVLLGDAVRAIDVRPGDGERALRQMCAAGAVLAADALAAHGPRAGERGQHR